MVEDGPKPPAQLGRNKFAANAPVNVVIYKISDIAGDVWERYKGSEEPLWQLQIAQDSARSITYQWRDRFADYLRTTAEVPSTLQDLQEECGIRLVVGDKNVADLCSRERCSWKLSAILVHGCAGPALARPLRSSN